MKDADGDVKKDEDGETALPDLPDVPKNDPTEEGQPDSKRVKVDAEKTK